MTDEEVQVLQEKVEELTGLVGERDAAFQPLQDELADATSQLTEKDEQLTVATAAAGELDKAISSYKALVLEANPDIPGELIMGDTIEGIAGSLESAKGIVGKVWTAVEDKLKEGGVPAGAPARGAADLSGLSPMAKIRYGTEHPPK